MMSLSKEWKETCVSMLDLWFWSYTTGKGYRWGRSVHGPWAPVRSPEKGQWDGARESWRHTAPFCRGNTFPGMEQIFPHEYEQGFKWPLSSVTCKCPDFSSWEKMVGFSIWNFLGHRTGSEIPRDSAGAVFCQSRGLLFSDLTHDCKLQGCFADMLGYFSSLRIWKMDASNTLCCFWIRCSVLNKVLSFPSDLFPMVLFFFFFPDFSNFLSLGSRNEGWCY